MIRIFFFYLVAKNIYDNKQQFVSSKISYTDWSWTNSGLIVCPHAVIPGSYFTCKLQVDYDDDFAKIDLMDESGVIEVTTGWMKIPGKVRIF